MPQPIDELYWTLGIKDAGFVQGLTRSSAGVNKLRTAMAGPAGVIAGMAAMGVAMTLIGIKATKMGAQLDKALREVFTLLPQGAEDMGELRQSIIDLSTRVPAPPVQLTEGLYQVISAGITDTADAMQVLEVSARAATAGLTDTFTAVDAITTVLNAYQLEASEAGRVSDVFFTTVREGKLKFEDIAGTIGNVATSFALAGISVEELGAAMATMTKFGTSAAETTTALNRFVLSLTMATDDQVAAAEAMGLEWNLAALRAKGLVGFLQEMQEATGGNLDALAELNPNIRSARAAFILAGNGLGEYTRILRETQNASGAAGTAFDKMHGSLQSQWQLLKNKVNTAWLKLGSVTLPLVVRAIEGLNDLLSTETERQIRLLRSLGMEEEALNLERIDMIEDRTEALKEEAEAVAFVMRRYTERGKEASFRPAIGTDKPGALAGLEPVLSQEDIDALIPVLSGVSYDGFFSLGKEWSATTEEAEGAVEAALEYGEMLLRANDYTVEQKILLTKIIEAHRDLLQKIKQTEAVQGQLTALTAPDEELERLREKLTIYQKGGPALADEVAQIRQAIDARELDLQLADSRLTLQLALNSAYLVGAEALALTADQMAEGFDSEQQIAALEAMREDGLQKMATLRKQEAVERDKLLMLERGSRPELEAAAAAAAARADELAAQADELERQRDSGRDALGNLTQQWELEKRIGELRTDETKQRSLANGLQQAATEGTDEQVRATRHVAENLAKAAEDMGASIDNTTILLAQETARAAIGRVVAKQAEAGADGLDRQAAIMKAINAASREFTTSAAEDGVLRVLALRDAAAEAWGTLPAEVEASLDALNVAAQGALDVAVFEKFASEAREAVQRAVRDARLEAFTQGAEDDTIVQVGLIAETEALELQRALAQQMLEVAGEETDERQRLLDLLLWIEEQLRDNVRSQERMNAAVGTEEERRKEVADQLSRERQKAAREAQQEFQRQQTIISLIRQGVDGAMDLAVAFGSVDASVVRIVQSLTDAVAGAKTVMDSLKLIQELSAAGASIMPGIGGLVSGGLGLLGGLASLVGSAGTPDPETQRRLQVEEDNTRAIRELSESMDALREMMFSLPGQVGAAIGRLDEAFQAGFAGAPDNGGLLDTMFEGLTMPGTIRDLQDELNRMGFTFTDLKNAAQQAGIDISDLEEVWEGALEGQTSFGGELIGAKNQWDDLVDAIGLGVTDLFDTVAGRLESARREIDLFDITDPVQKIGKLVDVLAASDVQLSASELERLRAGDEKLIQELVKELETGTGRFAGGFAALGEFSPNDFLQVISEIESLGDALADEGGTTSFQTVNQITLQQADLIISALSTQTFYLRSISEHTAALSDGREIVVPLPGTPEPDPQFIPGPTEAPEPARPGPELPAEGGVDLPREEYFPATFYLRTIAENTASETVRKVDAVTTGDVAPVVVMASSDGDVELPPAPESMDAAMRRLTAEQQPPATTPAPAAPDGIGGALQGLLEQRAPAPQPYSPQELLQGMEAAMQRLLGAEAGPVTAILPEALDTAMQRLLRQPAEPVLPPLRDELERFINALQGNGGNTLVIEPGAITIQVATAEEAGASLAEEVNRVLGAFFEQNRRGTGLPTVRF